jgi:hypothetical protein
LFGATVVDVELLGMPFLLAGFAAVIAAATTSSTRAEVLLGLLGGAAGAAAFLVKQSLFDVFVLAAVVLVLQRRARPLVGILAGAAAVVGVATWAAHLRGTDAGALWDAVVVFRRQAASVIATSATDATGHRLRGLLVALAVSGAPIVAVALARRTRRPSAIATDLRWPAAGVLAWELVMVLGGGSYWLHYLMGLVPGLVLLAAAAAQRPAPADRTLRAAYAVAGISTVCALAWVVVNPVYRPEQEAVVWLQQHAQPGDTAVVGFGAPNILQATGMGSPYSDLWSLPVRVHDPDLEHLMAVLAGTDRPTWLVVAGTSLSTWGVDATDADRYVADHYTRATTAGDWTIYRRDAP